jgi:signal transduction histidine kinase/ligand-binding sensor domain-containing protein
MLPQRPATLAALLLCAAASSPARERVFVRYDRGLPVPALTCLAQDSDGFLWVGTDGGGIVRFDGNEFLSWTGKAWKRRVDWLWAGPDGEVLALPRRGETLLRIVKGGVEPLAGPNGEPFSGATGAAYDTQGRLWVARRDSLARRNSRSASWSSIDMARAGGEAIRGLRAGFDGEMLVITSGGAWRISDGEGARKIYSSRVIGDLIPHPRGSLFLVEKPAGGGHVIELRDGRATEVLFLKANAGNFVLRGEVVWLTFDRYVVAFRSGRKPEILGPADNIGGIGFVDREGSLWITTVAGLIEFPEPETIVWNDKDGLPSGHTRFLHQTREGIWVSTWQGLGRFQQKGGSWTGRTESPAFKSQVCEDRHGVLWTLPPRYRGSFFSIDFSEISRCSPSADGSVWIANQRGLFRTGPVRALPTKYIGPFGGDRTPDVLFEDRRGRLLVAVNNEICSTRAVVEAMRGSPDWLCSPLAGATQVSAISSTPAGSIWAGTPKGVWRFDGNSWRLIPGSDQLPSTRVAGLVPSPRGGVWVLGASGVFRVLERPDLPAGWQVVERLTAWQGFPDTPAADLIEEPNGELWVATSAGVIQIPAEARSSPTQPPPMKLVAIFANGQRREPGPSLRLSPGENQLELEFASLSFRDRGLLRCQYRLRTDRPWIDSRGTRFQFVSLSPGRYTAEIRASLDGENWSTAPVRVEFEVVAPWYRRPWALVAFVLAMALIPYSAQRARAQFLLRLERQRTRIAMDLHDEIGSGLGSINILSGLAAEDSLDEAERRQLAARISETAGELSNSLAEIVGAIRDDSGSLEALASHLTRRARRLFPDSGPALATEFPPAWPDAKLSLAAWRNVMLIALEALHNASRHARAEHVVLGMAPEGKRWRLWVTDDGKGLAAPDVAGSSGMGLENMRRRAGEIGAEISWQTASGAGTTVCVIFRPAAAIHKSVR